MEKMKRSKKKIRIQEDGVGDPGVEKKRTQEIQGPLTYKTALESKMNVWKNW